MKKVIFMIGAAILALCMNACKTQNKGAGSSVDNVAAFTSTTLVEKYWKLIELNGNPVIVSNNREAHIILKAEGNQFNGNAGCNRIVGTYQIQEPDRITFSQVVATRMMCLNMETEDKFLEALNTADSYIVKNDTLTLNRVRMAPLARFVAVYLK